MEGVAAEIQIFKENKDESLKMTAEKVKAEGIISESEEESKTEKTEKLDVKVETIDLNLKYAETVTHAVKCYENKIKEKPGFQLNVGFVKKESDSNIVESNSKVLKRKLTEDEVTMKRVLSEGEASSGFETISSLDSNVDISDLDLSSSIEDDHPIVREIENEFAFQRKTGSRLRVRYKNVNGTPLKCSQTDYYVSDYSHKRHGNCKHFRGQEYWHKSIDDKTYKYGNRDKKFSERKDFDRSRPIKSHKKCSTSSDQSCRRLNESQKVDYENIMQDSRSFKRRSNTKYLNYKERNSDHKYSEGFERYNKSIYKRNSPSRKKRWCSKSPSPSVFRSFSSHTSSRKKRKNQLYNKDIKKSFNNVSSRIKEQTPFLVELERRLEAERLQLSDTSKAVTKALTNVSAQNTSVKQNNLHLVELPAVSRDYHPLQHVPVIGEDNLPLVPGPTGLPVHITASGQQIPYDMDGRRIPTGPNRFYLPVDPMGRLFPHIISPENQAVPIHITEDGILRLPNSKPVPYGPGHQLPVNIDGKIILIGPDSKPLYPCSNLPTKPPPPFLKSPAFNNQMPEAIQSDKQLIVKSSVNTNLISRVPLQPSVMDFVESTIEKVNKSELLNQHSKREKNEKKFSNVEIEKNVPFSEVVKRSTIMEKPQKKITKNNIHFSSFSKISDSHVAASKILSNSNKDSIEQIIVSSDEEDNTLKIICGDTCSTIRSKRRNIINKKVNQAIKSLNEQNYKPPLFGRFIISTHFVNFVRKHSPNESPLLKNRFLLQFLTPNSDHSTKVENTTVGFKFLPQKLEKKDENKILGFKCKDGKKCPETKLPMLTFDFGVQCDFTSNTINHLKSKISKLEKNLVSLQNDNKHLLEGQTIWRDKSERTEGELRKVLLELQEKGEEIEWLKEVIKKRK